MSYRNLIIFIFLLDKIYIRPLCFVANCNIMKYIYIIFYIILQRANRCNFAASISLKKKLAVLQSLKCFFFLNLHLPNKVKYNCKLGNAIL